ncbi:MAG: esterase-like activity of phytase family protein, partial [Caulobacterales bacterium]|nr:esterase-like activity of phytase family protein [Caulobacterales bacterium]
MKASNTLKTLACATALPLVLLACEGDDGAAGPAGADGPEGSPGPTSLIDQTMLLAGDAQCFQGGLRIDSGVDADGDGALSAGEVDETSFQCVATRLNEQENFVRIASFPVCSQDLADGCDATDAEGESIETAAEIVDVSEDGTTLIYSDSPLEVVGFVDITTPTAPAPAGTLAVGGEPTSVAVAGDFVLVGVNTSADFVNTSGALAVVDIAARTVVRSIDLGGQPDSVAVSPDKTFAAIAIENERDEDLGDGRVGQAPAGFVVVVDIADADPANWTTTNVDVTGLADVAPEDPEPEYIDINDDNVAVVTLQENNHIVLIDLATAGVTADFTAGAGDLAQVDATEEDPALILQTESLAGVVREPDGVTWINNAYFATADEGDMDGGSRGFTVFATDGAVAFTAGDALDHLTARFGHYPDGRSGNKGNEPENAEVGVFGDDRYLFVNSERSSLIFVYDVADPTRPVLKQTLPAAAGPEGVKAIPSRNLVVAASEEDSRDDKLRSVVNIYRYEFADAAYPTISSVNREDGAPIPWAAMSGLAADPDDADLLYAIEDSFFASNRIFAIDVGQTPAVLTREIALTDANDVFAAVATSGPDADPDAFDAADLAAMINADKTVNIDPEGIAVASDGGFWIASEGAGTVTETDARPIEKLNFVFKTDADGVIEDVVTLPDAVNAIQVRFG